MYSYAWTIRICGSPPNHWQAFDFSQQNVWRWEGESDSPTNKHALGKYYSGTWHWGYTYYTGNDFRGGKFVLSYQNYGGTKCANTNDYGSSVIMLMCDYTRTKEDPYIEAAVRRSCQTWMIVGFKEMCSVFHPAPTPTPTRFPTRDPTASPTPSPTSSPTYEPTKKTAPPVPTSFPTTKPTLFPTASPTTYEPTALPTLVPTEAPTNPFPTLPPTLSPTAAAAEVCLD
jgi:hypothetical protein